MRRLVMIVALMAASPLRADDAEVLNLLHAYPPSVLRGCLDPRLRALPSYSGTTRQQIATICSLIENPHGTGLSPPGLQAVALWWACQQPEVLATDGREVCRRALATDRGAGFETDRDALLEGIERSSGAASPPDEIVPIVAQGALRFFTARAEAEVLLFLRDRIGQALCPGPAGIAGRLLPTTCQALAPGGTRRLDDTLIGLREAFIDDVARLPASLGAVLAGPERPLTPEERDVVCFLQVGTLAGTALLQAGPRQAFDALRLADPPACLGVPVWTRTVAYRQALAELIPLIEREIQAGHALGIAELRILLTELRGSRVGDEWRAEIERLDGQVAELLRVAGLVRRLARAEGMNEELLVELIAASFELVEGIAEHAALSEPTLGDLRLVSRALAAFAQRHYTTGLLRLLAIRAVKTRLATLSGSEALSSALAKYGPVIAAVAQARTPEDVEAILQAAAAPLGSWREYRRRPWAGFLGGLLGFGAGGELAFGDGDDGAFVSGFLPIGVELGAPIGKDWTVNFLVAPVDLGSLMSVRIGGATSADAGADGEARSEPERDLSSLLAPGLFVSLGLGNSPFVLTVGAQYLPAGRRYFACLDTEPTCSTTESAQALRLAAFVAVDLPAFPLW